MFIECDSKETEADYVNSAHIVSIRRRMDGRGIATLTNGQLVLVYWDADTETKKIIPAQPGFKLLGRGEGYNKDEYDAVPIIAWAINVVDLNEFCITPLTIDGPAPCGYECWAVQEPSGQVTVSGDRLFASAQLWIEYASKVP